MVLQSLARPGVSLRVWRALRDSSPPAWRTEAVDGNGAEVEDPARLITAQADSQTLLEQAKWLHELDFKVDQDAQNRAVAVLLSAGGLVALLAQVVPDTPTVYGWIIASLTGFVDVVAGALAAATLWPRSLQSPSPSQLRARFREHLTAPTGHGPSIHSVAESLLESERPDETSILVVGRRVAQKRMKLVSQSLVAIVIALVMTTVTVITKGLL